MSSKVFLSNVKFQDIRDSVSATDINASIYVYGGASIAKSLHAGISLNAPTIFEDGVRVATVDALPTVGTGLVLLDGTISVDAAQPGITSLGTLTSLSVTGNISSAAVPTDAAHLTNKLYVDSISYITAGTGLSKSAGTISVNAAQPGISSLGTLSTLAVTGNISSTAVPTSAAHSTNKLYVDSLAYITAGTGLSKSAGTISVNAAQPDVTSLGTLSVLAVTGNVSSTAVPADAAHLTNKLYVDSLSFLSVGTGLTRTGSTIIVNAAQPGITSLGTLAGLTSSGTVVVTGTLDASSPTTGILQVAGGVGIAKNVRVGGSLNSVTVSATGYAPSYTGPQTLIGYDTTNDWGFINSTDPGNINKRLFIQTNGQPTLVGGSLTVQGIITSADIKSGQVQFSLTDTFTTFLTLGANAAGMLVVNSAGGGTYAIFNYYISAYSGGGFITLVGGNNVLAQISGTSIQLKSSNGSTYPSNLTYTNMNT
jgi:hypothetical protein